ncbi:MAG: DUF3782 domain-containing protein [Candidatus Kapaibacteriota bacterium]
MSKRIPPTTFQMTDQELKDLIASLAEDTKRMKAEAAERDAEAKIEEKRRYAELDAYQKETARQLRELGKQIGGLGNKFGTFTEGLSLPSVQRLLFDRFGVEDFMPYRRRRFQGETIELDALGLVNGTRNEAFIVEIKSHLRTDGVEQLQAMMAKFRTIFPEYADKKLFGILTAASASNDALRLAMQAGFYVLTFEDDLMRFHDENGFTPKAY